MVQLICGINGVVVVVDNNLLLNRSQSTTASPVNNSDGEPEHQNLPVLFTPITIRNVTLKNRICVSPMSMYSAADGFISDFHFTHLLSFALGGAGLVMTEATAVTPDGRISPRDLGIWKDQHIKPWTQLAKTIKLFGAVPGIQLGHAGRKGSTEVLWAGGESLTDEKGGWPVIGASPLAYGLHIWKIPKEATIEDLENLMKAFVLAAKRAVKAGFEVIELHFGNGYLIHQFLSPVTNKRTDSFGGTLDNRMRLAIKTARMVRDAIPLNVVLGVRVSVSDLVANGWDIPQTIELAKELRRVGVDFLTCSSGQLVPTSQTNGMDKYVFQVPSAGLINKLTGLTTAAVGKIIDPKYAEKIVSKKTASLVMIGRAFLDNPHWPYRAADILSVPTTAVDYPKQYGYAIGDNEWRDLLKKSF
ncbi:NADPH dehydrogenase-like [Oppia nitens]|uniref:NADPH dehydrogenase-like n=1 Tax=Oppia nitens TaxID=1686743 RepID=UPI0023DBEEAA|nr:NADPH dehydrogenase-like [Oppia nitens]